MSSTKESFQSEMEVLWHKIRKSKVGMLTSLGLGNRLHSRPMMMAQDKFEGQLFFFSQLTSEKIDEIINNPNVVVTYSDENQMNFVSVYGHAVVSRNPSKLREHWVPALKAFFKEGVEDPNLCLIQVQVNEAEYWDSDQSRMTRLFEMMRASLSDHQPNLGRHGRIDLH